MAIILNDFIKINTTPFDLEQSIAMHKGIKFCLDFDGLNNDIDQTEFATYLVPLDTGFQCPRTLVYNDGNKVDIYSKFGLYDYDFVNIEIPHITINKPKYNEYGVIISKYNPYFGIFNDFAKHFKYVAPDNEESIILTNKELMNFELTPFELQSTSSSSINESTLAIKSLDNKLDLEEYEEFIDAMIDDNSFLWGIKMSIEIIKNKKINEKEACDILRNNPQAVHIYNVGEVKPSNRKQNQYYCFVDYKLSDGRVFGVSYSFNFKDGKFECSTSSKLYYLMKGFLTLDTSSSIGLSFDEEDIRETLLNKVFIPSIQMATFGIKNYPYITCDEVIGYE